MSLDLPINGAEPIALVQGASGTSSPACSAPLSRLVSRCIYANTHANQEAFQAKSHAQVIVSPHNRTLRPLRYPHLSLLCLALWRNAMDPKRHSPLHV